MNTRSFNSELRALIELYSQRANLDFQNRLKAWPFDLSNNEIHEVVGALLSRQVTLATHIATCPEHWTGHVAPIMLRSMADVYVNLAWVLCEPGERAKKFILHGLGQAKLEIEHRRNDLATRQPAKGELEIIDTMEDWVNKQRAMFLTDVNLGSWSGLSTRKMAEEANCIDFYNYVYTPFSACVHSTWNHIGKYNLRLCNNPLHGYHSIPSMVEVPIDLHYLILAARYLQKTFVKFDETFDIQIKTRPALDVLTKGLDKFGRGINRSPMRTPRRRRK